MDWYSGSALSCAHAVAQTLLGHRGSVTHSILLHTTTPSMPSTPSTTWCHTPHKLHSLGSASEETDSKQHEIDLPSLPLGFPVLGSPTSHIPTLLPTSDQGVSQRTCLACGWHGESLSSPSGLLGLPTCLENPLTFMWPLPGGDTLCDPSPRTGSPQPATTSSSQETWHFFFITPVPRDSPPGTSIRRHWHQTVFWVISWEWLVWANNKNNTL